MVHRSRNAILGIAITLTMAASPSVASVDAALPVPAGWRSARTHWNLGAGRLAMAVERATDPADQALAQRIVEGVEAFVVTDVAGTIRRLEVAPDGSSVLVTHLDGEAQWTSLVLTDGSIAWQKLDPSDFAYSNTGESLVSWDPKQAGALLGRVATYGLAGDLRRAWHARAHEQGAPSASAEPVALRGVLSVGVGDRIIVGLGRAVACLDLSTTPPARLWSAHLDWREASSRGLHYLSPTQFAMRLDAGRYKVVGMDGALQFPFEPMAWGRGIPIVRPILVPGDHRILFVDSTEDALLGELATWALSPVRLDLAAPADTERVPGMHDAAVLFASDTVAVVRRLGPF